MSKLNDKKNLLLKTVFRSIRISRLDLARKTSLNYRTVTRYADELESLGMIFCEREQTSPHGRPAVYYRSNSENLIFAGISLISSKLCFMLIDVNSCPLYSCVWDLPDDEEDWIPSALKQFEQILVPFPEKKICSICLNQNYYFQTEHNKQLFSDFRLRLQMKYKVSTEMYDSDSLILWDMIWSNALPQETAVIIMGEELRIAVCRNGEISAEGPVLARKLRHWKAMKGAADTKCPVCRRNGCINMIVRAQALFARLSRRTGKKTVKTDAVSLIAPCMIRLDQALMVHDPVLTGIFQEDSVALVHLVQKVRKELGVMTVHFFGMLPEEYQYFKARYLAEEDKKFLPELFRSTIGDMVLSAAEYARCQVIFATSSREQENTK